MRELTRAMLLEAKALAAGSPGGAVVAEALEGAGIRLPSGASAPASASNSRPGSARSQGSMRSAGVASSSVGVGGGAGSPGGLPGVAGAGLAAGRVLRGNSGGPVRQIQLGLGAS